MALIYLVVLLEVFIYILTHMEDPFLQDSHQLIILRVAKSQLATIMSVTANHRQMHNHAYMLIHQLSSGMWGKYQAMQDKMENCDRFMKMIIDIYEEHTKIPKKELAKILKHDLWWDAETCLKYGLVDEII